ncbi:MAG: hypothetical protein WCH59_10790 [Chitinophagia bacterium]
MHFNSTNPETQCSSQLMEKWLTLIHRASETKLISYRERMLLLFLYTQIERKLPPQP